MEEIIIIICLVIVVGAFAIITFNNNKSNKNNEKQEDDEDQEDYYQSDFFNDFYDLCEKIIEEYECDKCIDSEYYKKLIYDKINLGSVENYKKLNLEKECYSAILNSTYLVLTTNMEKIKKKAVSPLDCYKSLKNIHIGCANWLEKNNYLSKEDYYNFYRNF